MHRLADIRHQQHRQAEPEQQNHRFVAFVLGADGVGGDDDASHQQGQHNIVGNLGQRLPKGPVSYRCLLAAGDRIIGPADEPDGVIPGFGGQVRVTRTEFAEILLHGSVSASRPAA